MHLRFLGAAGTVTGSKTLLTIGDTRILVDCGLFQGYKQLRLLNWEPLPVPPSQIDVVVLTHAHLDHSGYLPLLVKNGFRGKVICTEATFELCRILLPDSGHLQEEDAAFANRHRFSKHDPALPLYTEEDAQTCLRQFSTVDFNQSFDLAAGVTAIFRPVGHILGAGMVTINDGQRSITFSGDLGRQEDLLMPPPAPLPDTDYLVVESTYGNRRHPQVDALQTLGQEIRETASRGGVVVIPAFAVGRAQSLMYSIHLLKASGAIPARMPVFLDSPMARDATGIYHRYRHDHKLTPEQCAQMCHAATIVNSVEESKAIDMKQMPMIVIAASGMATGGRVLHHLKAFASDPRNTILFAGFQAPGTRGATLLAGSPTVKIHGQYIAVRARVALVENLSAHADSEEILQWLSTAKKPPKLSFITHGEPDAADALRHSMEERLKWHCRVPALGDQFELR